MDILKIPPLKPTDSVLFALNLMETYQVRHLPIVNNDHYLGLISDEELSDWGELESKLELYPNVLINPHVHIGEHLLEMLSVVHSFSLTLLPILNEKHTFAGAMSFNQLAEKFIELAIVPGLGGIIELEVSRVDYDMSQIAQIIESNGAKILSSYIHGQDGIDQLLITLKVDVIDLSSIIKTFERYLYTIKGVYSDNSKISSHFDDRYDEFMKYLEF